jgi:hypothetical protein
MEVKELKEIKEVKEVAYAAIWREWNRTITRHDSMELLTCQVLLVCSKHSNEEK